MGKQEMTLQYQVKNGDRKWYHLWKPRFIQKEITIHDVEINVGKEQIDKDGNISYTLTASPKDIARQFEQAINDTSRS